MTRISANRTNRIAGLAVLLLLAACQTSGNESILSRALPSSGDDQQVAAVDPGQNPNATTRLKNTRSELSDYCPAVRIRAGTESFRDYPKGRDKENPDNIRYQATILKVARECVYVGQELQIKVGAKGRVITGPQGGAGSLTMPIRVAVTRGDETVYSKLHRPQSSIGEGSTNTAFSFIDEEVTIPAPTSKNVRVFIGFDEGPYNTP